MWKKEERHEELATQRFTAPAAPAPGTGALMTGTERATIGRSITLRGDVTGDEDLLIQGHVEGTVNLRQHSVTVGSEGEVVASIVGRVVTVEGRVEGDISGTEQVILRSSALVKGDIRAPRLVLEDGARFRGLVDMGEGEEDQALSTASAADSAARPTTGNGKARSETAAIRGSGTGAEPDVVVPRPAEAGSATAEATQGSPGQNAGMVRRPGEVETRIPA
jgi:cytoskeletal protein CcmA (bactofilin family)